MYQGEGIQRSSCAMGLIHDLCLPLPPQLYPLLAEKEFTILFLFDTWISWKLDLM